jgi:hypothetical protein
MTQQTKLERFISSFKDEAELRRAVVGLLERMPHTKNVRLTHGALEHGKDIVFDWIGPFDQRQLVACVVKNEKISGSADSEQGARTVYIQAEEALDTPLANPADGSEERVAQVFVISPYECPPATAESIKGKLQARPGQVTFLCGRELMEKFEKHYPDFLVFHSGLYGSYIAELEKGLDSDPAVVNLLFLHGFLSGPKTLTNFYVRPKFSRKLYQYKLQLAMPEPESLRSALTVHDWKILAASFRDLGRLTTAITFPEQSGSAIQSAALGLAQALKRAYEEAIETYRRQTNLTVEQRTIPKDEIRSKLEPADELFGAAQLLRTRAEPTLANFREALVAANELVAVHAEDPFATLQSPSLISNCVVESVSQQVPSILVRADFPSQILEFDETLTDSATVDILLTGPAGFGKTSFCKWQTLNDLRKYRDDQSNVIPIFVQLHQYAQGEIGTFESTFLKAPEFIALWEQNRDRRSGDPVRRFRLYLDGLDEVPSLDRQRQLLELAMKGKQCEPTMSIIVTGREHVLGTHLRPFIRLQVSDFDDDQVRELAAKWLDHDDKAINAFYEQLARVPALQSLMRVPLLATLIFGVYRNTKALPASRVSLYEMFVNLLAGGWDLAKNIHRHTKFGPAPKLTVLTKLAATLHLNARRDCNQNDFKIAVEDTLPGLEEKWLELLEEIVHDGLLIPANLTYSFSHLSFQEYLAARDLFEPTGRKASRAFKEFLRGDDWWREVATFYIALSPDPKDVEEFIKRIRHEVLSRTADENVRMRASYLLEMLMESFPGAKPNFDG